MFFKKAIKKVTYDINISDVVPLRHFDIDPEVESERLLSLKYVADEIYHRDILGDVAEAGVMCGYFAKYINQAFPDRELHLFDTFSGFDKQELDYDKSSYLTNKHDYSMFDNAPLAKVKEILPDAHYHIGLFNDTTKLIAPVVLTFTELLDMQKDQNGELRQIAIYNPDNDFIIADFSTALL
jgi:hypothetical protein